MGEVWRAHDEKLGREVALKLLPEAFAQDPERMARFEREARVLASLNHPNIAHLYGLEAAVPEVAGARLDLTAAGEEPGGQQLPGDERAAQPGPDQEERGRKEGRQELEPQTSNLKPQTSNLERGTRSTSSSWNSSRDKISLNASLAARSPSTRRSRSPCRSPRPSRRRTSRASSTAISSPPTSR